MERLPEPLRLGLHITRKSRRQLALVVSTYLHYFGRATKFHVHMTSVVSFEKRDVVLHEIRAGASDLESQNL